MELCTYNTTNWSNLDCGISFYGQQQIKFSYLAGDFCYHIISTSKYITELIMNIINCSNTKVLNNKY